MSSNPFPWKLALRDFIFVALDIAFVALSFYMAWGMAIKSWAWFIGIGVFGRYFSTLLMRLSFMRLDRAVSPTSQESKT